MGKNATRTFEQLMGGVYPQFTPLAKRYYYSFLRPLVTPDGLPVVLFLGNHSSGKSSLVNWIVGGDALQDVGVAPTDDGFTVLVYGETDEDVLGPAALSRLPSEFKVLEGFGHTFLQRLRVKIRNRETLKEKILIDSPGMIDAAEGTVSRDYDFAGVVKCLAQISDLVFFLLDPDKPGTTGETVTVFSRCLLGLEYKLRVLLNKCDAIASTIDFARVYGTACWNLARVLRTKDLPKIWTVYSGDEKQSASAMLSFGEFNHYRQEMLDQLRNVASRRTDNLYASAYGDFAGLSMRMCVMNYVSRKLCLFTGLWAAMGVAVSVAVALAIVNLASWSAGWRYTASVAAGLLCAGAAFGLYVLVRKFLRFRYAKRIDAIFASEYRRHIVVGRHDDVNQRWALIREETAQIVRRAPFRLPFWGESKRRQMDDAVARVFESYHKACGEEG